MSVEIQEIETDCAYCPNKTDKRAFLCPNCKKIMVANCPYEDLNYCGNCGFKLK